MDEHLQTIIGSSLSKAGLGQVLSLLNICTSLACVCSLSLSLAFSLAGLPDAVSKCTYIRGKVNYLELEETFVEDRPLASLCLLAWNRARLLVAGFDMQKLKLNMLQAAASPLKALDFKRKLPRKGRTKEGSKVGRKERMKQQEQRMEGKEGRTGRKHSAERQRETLSTCKSCDHIL